VETEAFQTHISVMLIPAQDQESAGAVGVQTRPGGRVGVTRLMLTDFRNYGAARLDLDTGPVVLTGPNGAGKTNLLEAVSFLSPGRGLRNAKLSEIDRHGAEISPGLARGWAVSATAETRRGPVRLGTGREPETGERRIVRIDGEPAKAQAALVERLGLIWLTPQMDRLFIEGPGARRRLLDRLVFGLDPAHASRVAAYEQAMRERSRLLRDGPADTVWLGALEAMMAEQGTAVAAGRRDAVDRIDDACADATGPFPHARLALSGTLEAWLGDMPALAVEDKFKSALAAGRSGDAASGGATLGPHRSDLAVTHQEKSVPAEQASTGEQKALLISILLAHAKLQRAIRGEPPILLFDEVAAHLDRARRTALFDIVAALESQAWLTGTDPELFSPLRGAARFLTVHDGALTETAP
jgi:DNA replication and repair protein RecF